MDPSLASVRPSLPPRSKSPYMHDPEQLAPIQTTMQRALHSSHANHNLPDDAYGSLPHDLANAASSYPGFTQPLHHGDISNHSTSAFGVSSPEEHHSLPAHIDHSTLHLDPNLSPEPSRHFHPQSSNHDFTNSPPTPPAPHNNASTLHAPPITPNTAPNGHFDMLPPPPSTHPSWQALHSYAQSHASAHGYALSINTTAKNRSRIKLACVCYGKPKNTHKLTPETRVRKNRVSAKTGCKMWVEGKRAEDGTWVLRVGQAAHNHAGRPSEGWAVQRKRTWGVKGGRVGVGGVTALEERRLDQGGGGQHAAHPDDEDAPLQEDNAELYDQTKKNSLNLESGGLVWRIVEQEMLRKSSGGSGGGGTAGQGRDRGVGRTVKILEERLPGISIFKRDVYNIRAQIKRARKAAGQQLGEDLSAPEDDADGDVDNDDPENHAPGFDGGTRPTRQNGGQGERGGASQIDPGLMAQLQYSAHNSAPPHSNETSEIERLRREVSALRHALALKTKEAEAKGIENEGLRVQLEIANLAVYNERGHSGV